MSRDGHRCVLIAIIGPSGVGKDTLMTAASRHPKLDGRVRFARRAVTRTALAACEDHDNVVRAGAVTDGSSPDRAGCPRLADRGGGPAPPRRHREIVCEKGSDGFSLAVVGDG